MPRVPVIEAPRIENQPFRAGPQNIRVSADAFGAAQARSLNELGRGLQDAGDSTDRIFQREQQRQSEIDLLRAKKRLNEYEIGLSSPGGAYSNLGEDATGITEGAQQDLSELEREIVQTTSAGARGAVSELFVNRRRSILGGLSRHESAQRKQVEIKLHEEGVEQEIDVYSAVPVDEEGNPMAEGVARMEKNIATHARAVGDANGLPDELVESNIKENVSAAHRGRIERLLINGEAIKAKKYLETHGDKLTEEDEAALEKVTKKSAVEQEAQDFVDSLGRAPLASQIAAARKIKDVDLRNAALSTIQLNHRMNEQVKSLNEEAALRSAWQNVGRPGAQLSAYQRSLMSADAQRLWAEENILRANNIPKVDDPDRKLEWLSLTPDERVNMPLDKYLREWAPDFSQDTREAHVRDLRSTRERKSGTPKFYGQSQTKRIDQAVRRANGLDRAKPLTRLSAPKQLTYENDAFEIQERLEEAEASKGSRLTPDEFNQIVDNWERGRVFERGFEPFGLIEIGGGDEIATSDVTVSDIDDVKVPVGQLTPIENQVIAEMLKANGVEQSEENLQKAAALFRIADDPTVSTAVKLEAHRRLRAMGIAPTRGQ